MHCEWTETEREKAEVSVGMVSGWMDDEKKGKIEDYQSIKEER